MYFQKEELDKLIELTDMYNLVSRYVKLEKRGDDYKGLCPFHNESNPSFSVSTKKKIAKCFSCGGGGNPISFLMQIERIPYVDAVYKLAEINNFPLKEERDESYFIRKKMLDMYNLAAKFYHFNLLNSNTSLPALNYLEKRGITKEAISYFNIGYAPAGDALFRLMEKENYDTYEMESSGLILSKDNRYFDFFRNRIIFPLTDQFGDYIALSGRVLDDSKPKYLNSKESLIFSKSKTLYNLNRATDTIKAHDRVFIFEGYMDVIAAFRGGITEAVAGMGVAFTKPCFDLLKPLTTNLILCYDSDEPGILATYNFFALSAEYDFNLKVLPILGFKDLDELVTKTNTTDLSSYIDSNTVDILTYFIDFDLKKTSLEDQKALTSLTERLSIVLPFLNKLEVDLISSALKDHFGFKLDLKNLAKKAQEKKQLPSVDYSAMPLNCYNTVLKRLFLHAINSKESALLIDSAFTSNFLFNSLPSFFKEVWDLLIYHYYLLYEVYNEDKFLSFIREYNLDTSLERILNLEDTSDIAYVAEDLKECLNYLNTSALDHALSSADSISELQAFYDFLKNKGD